VKPGEYLHAMPMGISKLGKSNAFGATMLLLANNFLFVRMLLPFIDAGNQKDDFFQSTSETKEYHAAALILEMILLLHYGRFVTFQIYDHVPKALKFDPNLPTDIGEVLVTTILSNLGPAFHKLYAEDWFGLKATDQGRCVNCANATITLVSTLYNLSLPARECESEDDFQKYVEENLNEPVSQLKGLADKCKCRPKKHVFKRCVTKFPKFLVLTVSYDTSDTNIGYTKSLSLHTSKVITTQEKVGLSGSKVTYDYETVTSLASTDYILSGLVTSSNPLAHTVYVRDLLSDKWISIKDEKVLEVKEALPTSPNVLMYTQSSCLIDEIDDWSRIAYSHINPYIFNMLKHNKRTE